MSSQAISTVPSSTSLLSLSSRGIRLTLVYTAPATAGNLGSELKPTGNASAQVKVRN